MKPHHVGHLLADHRRAAGMTQADLAERLCVSRSLIAQWETGLCPVTERHRPAVTAALRLRAFPSIPQEPAMNPNFAVRNLSVLAYAQGFTLWHYRANGLTLAQATAPGFFSTAADMIAAGDMILISSPDGGTVAFVSDASEARGVTLAEIGGDAMRRAA